ncbi:MAG: NAD(P)H-dependent glycerol-3-phosphate dehydrogenase [Candidatus Marinimicrobia bacterium]|nr:NAD(P)H-dependent glycerol-3-phosphate dehydrogenase [Candidatus Neomarinimicrobiota bacterium]
MANISLLGCGTWGSALAQCLAENGHPVVAWHYKDDIVKKIGASREHPRLGDFIFHDNIQFEPRLESCLKNSNCIIVAVPSHAVRDIISQAADYIPNDAVIVNVAKGIENNTLETMSEVIAESSNHKGEKIVSLYGPSHAEEVIAKHPTTLVSASISNESAKYVQAIFSSEVLRVYTNNDIRGVELGGSLKNVIAIAAGICDGIGFGDNTKAALLTRGISEITRLGIAMGAKSDTFSGLSGIGDLIVTCLSRHSRNRFVGEAIGKGRKLSSILNEMAMVAEGVKTTQSVHDLSQKYGVEMPISEGVYQILFNENNPKKVVTTLMTRNLTREQ